MSFLDSRSFSDFAKFRWSHDLSSRISFYYKFSSSVSLAKLHKITNTTWTNVSSNSKHKPFRRHATIDQCLNLNVRESGDGLRDCLLIHKVNEQTHRFLRKKFEKISEMGTTHTAETLGRRDTSSDAQDAELVQTPSPAQRSMVSGWNYQLVGFQWRVSRLRSLASRPCTPDSCARLSSVWKS